MQNCDEKSFSPKKQLQFYIIYTRVINVGTIENFSLKENLVD